MISSVTRLTEQMAMLTTYFERAGDRLHVQKTEELDQAVERILHEQYGLDDDTRVELALAMTMMRSLGAELFVKKLLWGSDEQDRGLAASLAQVIPRFELLVQEHPILLLSQAADCLAAIEKLKLSGVANDGRTA
ncbi:hypothetical protein [Herbaspirillum sp. AP21]|nr:hypothetical protein [Herbaspirillum sp. AP21]NZD69717.1 hypothetical protein [Herbaspirillum sp. AP21]